MTTNFTVERSLATLLDASEDEHAQVTRDVREVAAVALLANKRLGAIFRGAERKVCAISLFLHTASGERG